MTDRNDAIRTRVAPPTERDFSCWLPLRTRNRDTDQFGHVNHSAMATLFEESRIALIFARELKAETVGVDLLVAKLTMEFHQELRAPGEVRIGAQVSRIGSSSLDIRQAIFSADNCHASAVAVCVLLDQSSRKPFPVSDALRVHLLSSP